MELVADLLVTAVSVAVVGLHIRAVRNHFFSETTPTNAKVIAGVTLASVLAFLFLTWSQHQPLWAQAVGIVIEMGSAFVFFAAIRASKQARLRFVFDPAHPHTLIATGPYTIVRHPFYVSYILFWAGWSIAVWSPFALISLALLIGLYIAAARLEESNFAASPLAAEHAAYKSRVGFFWPKIG